MKTLIARLVREEAGQDLIEYALLAAFIALVAIVAMTTLGEKVNSKFEQAADKLK